MLRTTPPETHAKSDVHVPAGARVLKDTPIKFVARPWVACDPTGTIRNFSEIFGAKKYATVKVDRRKFFLFGRGFAGGATLQLSTWMHNTYVSV